MMVEKLITLMIVEDNVDYGNAVQLALQNETWLKFETQFSTAEAALRMLDDSSSCPTVVLLDIRLPGMTGIEAIPEILARCPKTRIVILTQSDQRSDVEAAIEAGAAGYLLKSAAARNIIEAIQSVAGGHSMIDPAVAKFIFDGFRDKTNSASESSLLSDREVQVLRLLARGMVKKEIAAQLEIGYSTVDTHVSRIYGKLKVNNAPAAVNRAHLLNILTS